MPLGIQRNPKRRYRNPHRWRSLPSRIPVFEVVLGRASRLAPQDTLRNPHSPGVQLAHCGLNLLAGSIEKRRGLRCMRTLRMRCIPRILWILSIQIESSDISHLTHPVMTPTDDRRMIKRRSSNSLPMFPPNRVELAMKVIGSALRVFRSDAAAENTSRKSSLTVVKTSMSTRTGIAHVQCVAPRQQGRIRSIAAIRPTFVAANAHLAFPPGTIPIFKLVEPPLPAQRRAERSPQAT